MTVGWALFDVIHCSVMWTAQAFVYWCVAMKNLVDSVILAAACSYTNSLHAHVCCTCAAACTTCCRYIVQLALADKFSSRIDVYDGQSCAPANWLLIKRADNSTATLSNSSTPFARAPEPCGPRRWQLPADLSGMQAIGDLMSSVERMEWLVVRGPVLTCWPV